MKIAVVEDDTADILIYRYSFLQGEDFDVYNLAQDFVDQDKKYDVVFLDLNLPDKWGLPVVRMIREAHAGKLIIVTGTGSGYLRGKNMADIIHAGADEVFQKNFLDEKSYIKMIKEEFLNG